ncbi:hypothetical protein [Candidatus Binatus sp.]|uniref:hypothetical protein n=1 Tax=Candidatus Binatus sp. TaxID=2811406 RepID=UPI003C69571B
MKPRGYATLFVTSCLIAAFSFVAPLVERLWPNVWVLLDRYWQERYHRTLLNPFASFTFEIVSKVIWVSLVVIALRVYGKRGWWLVMGLPFLIYNLFILFLVMFNVGDWVAYQWGDSAASFLTDHFVLFYAGFWLLVDFSITVLIGQLRLGSAS